MKSRQQLVCSSSPFLTFERFLGLVGLGSRAFILHAIHSEEREKVCLHFMSVSGKDAVRGRGQCKQSPN